jgi:two-component sensor histidine kinase
MTQSDLSFAATVLDQLTSAASRDAVIRVAIEAGSKLAGIDGLCLVARAGKSSLVALAGTGPVHACEMQEPNLHRLIPAAIGERRPIGMTFVVPLDEAAGYRAVEFFWPPGSAVDRQQTSQLELLAKYVGLAANTWLQAEKHERQLQDQCRMATELQHRLRNNLALMRSIVRRSIETAASAEQFALHLEGRLCALGRTQAGLTAAGSIGVDLEELIRTELIANAVHERRCVMSGPVVRLHAKGAESLGLAIHELATNSLKFGALQAAEGRLAIHWDVTSGTLPALHLTWIESGVTMISAAPRRRGFGQELIECTLPYELGALTRLDFSPGGVQCEMDIPLEACATLVQPVARRAMQAGAS